MDLLRLYLITPGWQSLMLLLAMVVLRHEREVGGLLLHNISRTTRTTIFLGFVRIACLIKHVTALASKTSTKVTFGDIL